MASIIAENGYLIPKEQIDTYAEKDRFLLFVTNLENTKNES